MQHKPPRRDQPQPRRDQQSQKRSVDSEAQDQAFQQEFYEQQKRQQDEYNPFYTHPNEAREKRTKGPVFSPQRRKSKSENVVILGASDKADRYSYQALHLLQEKGHHAIPVHPQLIAIEGIPCFLSLSDVKAKYSQIDTVTVYVRPEISNGLADAIIALYPSRVIFNPETENFPVMETLEKAGIEVITACTLVMLKTGQF